MKLFRLAPAFLLFVFSSAISCSHAKTDFNTVGREMVIILQNGHYAHLSFDDAMSERIFWDYLRLLDPQRLYFTKPQVDELYEEYATELDDLLMKSGGIPPAQKIYMMFLERLKTRVAFNNSLIEQKGLVFKTDQKILRDREEATWPASQAEAKELWKLYFEESVLSEVLRRESIRKMAEEQGKDVPKSVESDEPYAKVGKRYERILRNYEEADEEEIANYFLSTVAAAYDPHSDYFSKREMDSFRDAISNSLVGIGALLSSEDDGATKIKGIVNGGPADKQGELGLNDRIVGVDPLSDGNMIDIIYMPISKVVSHIKGKEGTKVTLKVEPADGASGETKLIVIDRDVVEMKEQMASAEVIIMKGENEALPPTRKLGWLQIPSFYRDFQNNTTSVARDVEALLERMNQEEVEGLVIDLRGNGGGSLDEVLRITGYFVGSGPVVQIKNSLGQRSVKNSYSRKALFKKPVVVLVDKTSASASEILAAALQDYNRAIVIGDTATFGKGTVQQPMEISKYFKWFQDKSRAGMVKPTIQKFYRISGGSTQLKGVESDIILPSVTNALEIGERYARHALEYDHISPSRYEVKGPKEALFIPQIREKSAQRIAENQDFSYIEEDAQRVKKRVEKNLISLNIETRRAEIEESELRRKQRVKEQLARFEKIAKADENRFGIFRLSLEDLQSEVLPEMSSEAEEYMIKANDDLAELDNSPEWPTGLDPVKRESLRIISDLVALSDSPQTARVED